MNKIIQIVMWFNMTNVAFVDGNNTDGNNRQIGRMIEIHPFKKANGEYWEHGYEFRKMRAEERNCLTLEQIKKVNNKIAELADSLGNAKRIIGIVEF